MTVHDVLPIAPNRAWRHADRRRRGFPTAKRPRRCGASVDICDGSTIRRYAPDSAQDSDSTLTRHRFGRHNDRSRRLAGSDHFRKL